MGYLAFESEYDKFPQTSITGYDDCAYSGWEQICAAVNEASQEETFVIVDCYPGVDDSELLPRLMQAVQPELTINMEDLFYDGDELTRRMEFHLTDDRVRGILYYGTVNDFIDPKKLSEAREQVKRFQGRVLLYGFGAALLSEKGLVIYADMARWEIQLRYRAGMPNYKQKNYEEDNLIKYKRGFFIEWRIADRHKSGLYNRIDFYLDTNTKNKPAMVSGEGFRQGLKQLTEQPFRLVPYFDPGVWGGQWMKEVCKLDPVQKNYAWSFDGVPEENSIFLNYGGVRIESPAMNLTLYQPKALLGQKNFARFGAEFPIRFDFLDTMGGQNLSLQVHPLTEYIHQKFGMAYTQDESYYILDAADGAGVYLGLQDGVNPEEMIADLEEAQRGSAPFNADRYVNFFPAKKHDHYLIPAGTIHCSSQNCMVLEISATPYIFTFKLWDWDRVGLDGKPRPIHIDDGKKVLQFDRTTQWVKENLVNHFEKLEQTPDYTVTKTGLHELEFIETQVLDIRTELSVASNGEVAMCNLVEGTAAVIESTENRFPAYTVHYAETFVIPANAGGFRIRSREPEESIKVLKAHVRN